MKRFLALALLLALALPIAASAQAGVGDTSACSSLTTGGVAGIVSCIIGFFNSAIYLIMAFAVLYIVWGAFKLMKEEGREEGKNIVMFGIIGLFVMISIWGLVNILDRTFNLSDDAVDVPNLIPGQSGKASSRTYTSTGGSF